MYFSNHNEDTVYINHFSGLLEVEGTGPLCVEDTKVHPCFEENWADDFDTLSVKEGITELGEGYLETFTNVTCLILARTVTAVATTPKLDGRMRKNKVLVCGEYNTFAEKFAAEKKLKFLHCDIPLAIDRDEEHHEVDHITLRFHTRGKPDIHHDIYTPGSSAGSYGGGEIANEIPEDFYVGCTIEKFAANFHEGLREQLMSNDMLRRFLEEANARHGKK
ncbi:MAG: hypothetical protein J5824_07270 [Lachnospiraceae bacterium]|nr:hypothetical protein [Lachnospiraceae bacterium]